MMRAPGSSPWGRHSGGRGSWKAAPLPSPSQLEANQTDNPSAPQHRPNDFHIKQPDVLLCHLPIPFQYRPAPK